MPKYNILKGKTKCCFLASVCIFMQVTYLCHSLFVVFWQPLCNLYDIKTILQNTTSDSSLWPTLVPALTAIWGVYLCWFPHRIICHAMRLRIHEIDVSVQQKIFFGWCFITKYKITPSRNLFFELWALCLVQPAKIFIGRNFYWRSFSNGCTMFVR